MKNLKEIVKQLESCEYECEGRFLAYNKDFMLLKAYSMLEQIRNSESASWWAFDRRALNDEYDIHIYGREFEDRANYGVAPNRIILCEFDEEINLGFIIIKRKEDIICKC